MKPLHLAFISDGKPGHINQLLGLEQALSELTALESQWIYPRQRFDLACLKTLSRPLDGLIAAGHRTHGLLLWAGIRTGATTVVLMKPSLPVACFGRIIVPAHDGLTPGARVMVTEGVLNRIQPGGRHDPGHAVFLLGGPSKHYHWCAQSLSRQIRSIIEQNPNQRYSALSSRRTPKDFLAALDAGLETIAPEQSHPDTLPSLLAEAGQVWVTEDSVSMVYEALTSGARVGLLTLRPQAGRSRVVSGIERLKNQGWLTPFQAWLKGAPLAKAPQGFNEARRVAEWLLAGFKRS